MVDHVLQSAWMGEGQSINKIPFFPCTSILNISDVGITS